VARLGFWLLSLSLLAACAGVLGIEERKLDSASNYPLAGYPGCLPGNCAGCLDVHRDECQLRTACADSANHTDCAGCVCQNCLEPVVDCQLDAGCAAIWQCLRETRCDLSERAAGSCVDSCGSVIQTNGGLNGPAFRAAAEIRTCATTAACLSCLAPQVQQSTRSCTQANACQDCPDCFDQCLCSGEKFGNCQRFCGEEAPPAACTDADSCAGCSNCFDACACDGGSYDDCISACTSIDPDPNPTPMPTCTPEDSCSGCSGCRSQCLCSGAGDSAQCKVLCDGSCVEAARSGASSCGGCQSCIAKCTCAGTPIEDCLADDCGPREDCPNGYGCDCETASSEACFSSYTRSSCDDYPTCEACTCHQCPGELGMCFSSEGCRETFDCMRATGCRGGACLERCRGSDFPVEAFAYAEALWACYQGSQCQGCTAGAAQVVTCPTGQGAAQCQGFLGNSTNPDVDPNLSPCCSSGIGIPLTEPIAGTPDSNPCGLDLSSVYRQARACEPREQSNPPRAEQTETCPGAHIKAAPYNGALLRGCCRGADQTCGYFDDITGLGCLSAGIFDAPVQPCPSSE
jgi:hypothetical protein